MDSNNTNEKPLNQEPVVVPGNEIRPTSSGTETLGATPTPTPAPVTPTLTPSGQAPVTSVPQPTPIQSMPTPTAQLTPDQSPQKSSKKRTAVFAAVIAAFLFVGGSAAAYLGVYLPNQPDNIWKSALGNTAKGYDKLLSYEEEQKEFTTTKLTGDYRIQAGSQVFDGNYSVEGDSSVSKTSVDVGIAGARVNMDMLVEVTETSPYPDLYIKASGLDAFNSLLAGTSYEGLPATINDQWYFIDHSLFDQALPTADLNQPEYDGEDVRALLKAFGEVNREYVFTTDESKAIFNQKEYIGEETIDNRKQHHFKVGMRKENFKKYAQALRDKLSETDIYKTISSDEDDLDIDGFLERIDRINENDTVDVWVDGSTKLFRTVRITEKGGSSYMDIGLKYDGGNEYPFYLELHVIDSGESAKTQAKLTATLNTDDNNIKFAGTASSDDDSFSAVLNGLLVRSKDEVQFDKPTDAKPIMDLFGNMYGGAVNPEDVLGISTPLENF